MRTEEEIPGQAEEGQGAGRIRQELQPQRPGDSATVEGKACGVEGRESGRHLVTWERIRNADSPTSPSPGEADI